MVTTFGSIEKNFEGVGSNPDGGGGRDFRLNRWIWSNVSKSVRLTPSFITTKIARASGGANNMHPLSGGRRERHKRKRSEIHLTLGGFTFYLIKS